MQSLIVILIAFALPAGAAPQSRQAAFIEGVVVKMGSGEPLAGAKLDLHPEKGGVNDAPEEIREYTATSAADGKFLFSGVQPGRYRLTATRDGGFVPGEYGQRSATTPGIPFDIADGQRLTGIQLALAPTGSISGRIYDRDGEPLGKAEVHALRAAYKDGRRTLTSIQTAETNDRGEYRLFWLAPGTYYVSARPDIAELPLEPGSQASAVLPAIRVTEPARFGSHEQATPPTIRKRRLKTGEVIEETHIPVYYPGVTDAQTATPVGLVSNANVSGVDVAIAAGIVPARHIRGRVINATNGQPLAGATVTAIPLAGGAAIAIPGSLSGANGSFDLAGATTGTYVVFAESQRMTGSQTVEIGSEDIQNIAVVVRPPFKMSGRFFVEGRARARIEARISDLRVAQFERDPALLGLPPGGPDFNPPPRVDGTFELTGVHAGDFRVSVRAVPPDAYVKSIRLGSADVLDGGLHLSTPPESTLEIVIGSDAGRLSGVVFNARQEALANRTVVLIPDIRLRHRADLFKSVNTDGSGRFQMQGITPGTYQLMAWESIESGAWRDPDFLRAYEGRGKAIQVNEGGEENVPLTVLP